VESNESDVEEEMCLFWIKVLYIYNLYFWISWRTIPRPSMVFLGVKVVA